MMSACWSPGSMMLGLSAADCGHAGDGGNSLEARRIRVGGSRVFFLDGMTFRAQPLGQNEAAARLSDLLCFTIRCRHRQGDDRCQHDMLYAHPNLRCLAWPKLAPANHRRRCAFLDSNQRIGLRSIEALCANDHDSRGGYE